MIGEADCVSDNCEEKKTFCHEKLCRNYEVYMDIAELIAYFGHITPITKTIGVGNCPNCGRILENSLKRRAIWDSAKISPSLLTRL